MSYVVCISMCGVSRGEGLSSMWQRSLVSMVPAWSGKPDILYMVFILNLVFLLILEMISVGYQKYKRNLRIINFSFQEHYYLLLILKNYAIIQFRVLDILYLKKSVESPCILNYNYSTTFYFKVIFDQYFLPY